MRPQRHAILTRRVFQALLILQGLHLGEHLVQMAQIYLLGWPPPLARGVVSTLDVEKVHFIWNLVVLTAIAWLLHRGIRSAWLVATLAWAALHTAEHGFLLTTALLSGLEGRPGILGAGGLLAHFGWNVPGLTTWSRPTVHFAWNTGEVALLALAWPAFAGVRLRSLVRIPLVALPLAVTGGLMLLIPLSAMAPLGAITTLAPVEIWAHGFRDLRGVVIDASGNVFVADREAGTVTRIAPNHTRTVVARRLQRPIGLAFDPDGLLLIAEERAGRVVRVESNGSHTTIISGIREPRWVTVRDDGTLYVSARRLTRDTDIDGERDDVATGQEVILALSPAAALSVFAAGFRDLQGLAVNHTTLFAAAGGGHGLRHVTGVIFQIAIQPNGTAGTITPVGPTNAFRQPVGLVRDRLGALYLTTPELSVEQAREDERARQEERWDDDCRTSDAIWNRFLAEVRAWGDSPDCPLNPPPLQTAARTARTRRLTSHGASRPSGCGCLGTAGSPLAVATTLVQLTVVPQHRRRPRSWAFVDRHRLSDHSRIILDFLFVQCSNEHRPRSNVP